MKKLALLALLALTGCATTADNETGVSVSQVQTVLDTVRQEVTTWDTNADGVLTRNEMAALIVSLSGRLYLLFGTD